MKPYSRLFLLLLACLVLLMSTGCGAWLHPERKGQTGGDVDFGVVILDTMWVFVGVIPGIYAFAVDISHGTLYYPSVDISDAGRIKAMREEALADKESEKPEEEEEPEEEEPEFEPWRTDEPPEEGAEGE